MPNLPRSTLLLSVALTLACTSTPELDDEAGVTTSPSTDPTDVAEVADTSSIEESGTTIGDDDPNPTSATSSSSNDGPLFIGTADDGPWGEGDCDTFLQDCPDGEKCVPYASMGGTWDANKCVPILGNQSVGEPCTSNGPSEGTDDCDGTSWCFNVDAMDVGSCYAFCTGSVDMPECPPMSACSITNEGSINICIPTCDPLVQDCPGAQGCYWGNQDFNCFATATNLPTGDPCGFINDCAPGNMCIDGAALPNCAGSACCANFCDLTLGDSQCAGSPGTSCVPFFEMGQAPPEYEKIGLCALAP